MLATNFDHLFLRQRGKENLGLGKDSREGKNIRDVDIPFLDGRRKIFQKSSGGGVFDVSFL